MASFPQWTEEDQKRFETALAQFSEASQSFLKDIAEGLQKPLEEVTYYYNKLVCDVDLIDSGKVALPKYREDDDVSPAKVPKSTRKKGIPWSQEEQTLFLDGLQKYGKGNWKSISRECVKTRTPKQVASHAQKYFLKQELGSEKRKRWCVNDMTLESTTCKPNFGKQNPPDDDNESQGSCPRPLDVSRTV